MQIPHNNTWNRSGWVILTSGVVITATVIALQQIGGRQSSQAQSPLPTAHAPQEPVAPTDPELLKAEGLSRAFRAAAQKVLPAVVVIKAGASPECPRCGRAHEPDAEDGESSANTGQQKTLALLGSGFIVAPSGIVLTNKHVVRTGRRLVVQTADGKQLPVKEAKTDKQHDVAVLKIEAETELPFVSLGDSDKAEIGDWVLTIGCPLELEQTVSAGIISAKNRSFCSKHQTRYLQTDAVINPGSSGGPLVALNGTVIGITTSIASEDGGYQGIGFAVPASIVRPVLTRLTESMGKESPLDKSGSL